MLSSICTHNSVVLYWDLPENFSDESTFSVKFLDRTEITEKCHIKIENLIENTEYGFDVYMGGEKIGTLICKTQPKKHRIDITMLLFLLKAGDKIEYNNL